MAYSDEDARWGVHEDKDCHERDQVGDLRGRTLIDPRLTYDLKRLNSIKYKTVSIFKRGPYMFGKEVTSTSSGGLITRTCTEGKSSPLLVPTFAVVIETFYLQIVLNFIY